MKQVGIEDVPHFAFNIKSDTTMEDIISDCFIVAANLESSVPNLTGRKYTTKAIWDTGATNSCISYRVVESLKLEPISTTPVITASDEVGVEAFVYLVDIGIPDLKVGHSKVAVLGMKMKDDALIGMDIIGMGDFAISGGRIFSYCTPPCPNPIDLVEKANRINKRKGR